MHLSYQTALLVTNCHLFLSRSFFLNIFSLTHPYYVVSYVCVCKNTGQCSSEKTRLEGTICPSDQLHTAEVRAEHNFSLNLPHCHSFSLNISSGNRVEFVSDHKVNSQDMLIWQWFFVIRHLSINIGMLHLVTWVLFGTMFLSFCIFLCFKASFCADVYSGMLGIVQNFKIIGLH